MFFVFTCRSALSVNVTVNLRRTECDHTTQASLTVRVCVGCQSYHRLPAQQHFGLPDVWSSPLGVVLGFWEELDLTAAHCV